MLNRLVGNDNAKITLRRLIASGRIPHSFLFAGDDGVGKRQFALELAKSLLCTEPADGEACGACTACRRADVFSFPKNDDKDSHERIVFSEHPDLGIVIPYNRNVLVKAIRHLESEANFRPYEAEARIFIIDDADKMNDSATNALLKTLEEPPPTTYLFLITSRPDSLLATIRSRCQMMRFAPIDTAEIERCLIEDRAFTHDEAKLAASLSRGSIGRAVRSDVSAIRSIRQRMLAVLRDATSQSDLASLLKISEEMSDAKNKDSYEENLDILESLIRDLWQIQTVGDARPIVNADLTNELTAIASSGHGRDLPAWIAAIEKLRMDLIVNINKRVATDGLFASMSA